ncbi:MAG: SpoIIE family protein phosphatase [Bacteroidales bacterium]|nr:SpoIIE family protein phosphatase [Bacteroidales bacterium]MBK7627075.1 SpoIIE family protein phosphatase [Bacteroidales bacterium]
MASRKTTIFRQLIFNIALPTLLALLVFSAINFQRTRSILSSGTAEKNKLLANEVTKILKFQDIATNLIDVQLNNRLKELNSLLVNKYFANTSNLDKVDLFAIANEIGMDTINEAIYIISSDGIIINTTFRRDLGFDLYSLGENMKKYLQDMQKSGEFFGERFAIEDATKRPKKYTYQATKDKKYIIELGAYSKQVDDIVEAIEVTKSELKSETQGIIDVELFLWADFAFSMNKNVMNVDQDTILPKVFHDKDTIEFMNRVEDRWYHYNYIYMERFAAEEVVGASFYQGSVIRIISDRTEQMDLFRKEAVRFIFVFVITMIVLSVVIYRKTKVITLPIKKLVENVDRIMNGDLRERAEVIGNNEITRLSEKFNLMIAQLESYYYELEQKVKDRTIKIEKQKEEIEEQKKHIMDSIYYARRIQNAILPSFNMIDKHLKNYFVLYMPKDIVSGDFYWMHEADGLFMVSAVDCTGHGVPGAFMSIVGYNQLNFAVNVKKARTAANILDELNKGVVTTLNENKSDSSIKDGMDMALCVFDFAAKKVEFAGANNPLVMVRNNTIVKFKGDRFPIGAFEGDNPQLFKNTEIELIDGDCIYISSDGYVDQFGGPENKKFMSKRFEDLLLEINNLSMTDQKEMLQKRLSDWKGENEQVDDILVIGIRV